MLILSTTFLVDESVADVWKQWVKAVFITYLCESSAEAGQVLFCKVHTDAQQDGQTFSLQIQFANLESLERFSHEIYPQCEQLMNRKFSGNFLSFQTVLEPI